MEYHPLTFHNSEIRILTLHTGVEKSSPITCTLETISLVSNFQYRALSYTWGNPDVTKPITVNGHEIQVTVNLEAALRQLRADNLPVLWVDSICIDQSNLEERSLQVQQMKAIYSRAYEVISWLGVEADDSEDAMDMLRSVHYGVNRFAVAKSEENQTLPASWLSFDALFMRPYWRRVWIIQEIAVAVKLQVYCGTQRVDWEVISSAMDEIKRPGVHPFFRATASKMSGLLLLRQRCRTGQPITLMQALWTSQAFLATDRRDKVFALLGITRDGSHLVPVLDYRRNVKDVFTDLTRTMIQMTSPPDIIALRRSLISTQELQSSTLHPSEALPSWVPDWSRLGDAPRRWQRSVICDDEFAIASDKNWFENIGLPFTSWKTPKSLEVQPGSLKASGYMLVTIDGVTSSMMASPGLDPTAPPPHNAMVQPSCRKLAYSDIGIAIQNCLTLRKPEIVQFSNTRSSGGPVLLSGILSSAGRKHMNETCPDFSQWYSTNKDFAVGDLTLSSFDMVGAKKTPDFSRAYAAAISHVLTSGMRLFVSTQGHLGMAHAQAQPGDMICYISGSKIPVVLRNAPQGVHVIGEAYLHGYRDRSVGDRPEVREFTIV